MNALTRRRDPHSVDCWLIYFGDRRRQSQRGYAVAMAARLLSGQLSMRPRRWMIGSGR